MEIYLPIAEMSVHWLVILTMGAAVGFLSGMFGVGGGFLLTPLLIFYGIPPGVAVATTASHLTASSASGAIAQWRRRTVDLKLGIVLVAGGVVGTWLGVWIFALLRKIGQVELAVSLGYVILLGVVGALMLNESLATLRAANSGVPAKARPRNEQRNWVHTLPLKMRFRVSRLYISAIPPFLIGVLVGMLSAVMGVGGGFVVVPAMIYLLRVPTNIVIGTSLFQILCVTALTTVLQATNNYTVDIVLAVLLVLGGVVGAQFGVRMAARMQGEHLRLLLGLLVLAVAMRLLWGLIVTPRDLYSVMAGGVMKVIAAFAIAAALATAPAAAEQLVSGLSQDKIQITSSYSGTDIVVFGAIENASQPKGRDVVVVIRGPTTDFIARRKARVAGIWVNSDRVVVRGMPAYYYLASTRPIDLLANEDTLARYDLGLDNIEPGEATTPVAAKLEVYRQAIVRARERQGLYAERSDGVEFLGPSLFRVRIPVPAAVPRGQYNADVYLVRDGAIIGAQSTPLFIEQAGLERGLFNFAHDWPLAYGVSAVVMSLVLGWLSSVVFRQNR